MSPFTDKLLLLTQEILIHSQLIDLNNLNSECLFKLCATIHGPYRSFIISLPADPIVIYYISFIYLIIRPQGMVLVSEKLKPTPCLEFEADICILYHTTSVSKGYQATIHIGNVCQNAVICDMDKVC